MTPEKPRWSTALRVVLEIEKLAELMRSIALDMRCMEEESGGARCTADNTPGHQHRIEMEDLP